MRSHRFDAFDIPPRSKMTTLLYDDRAAVLSVELTLLAILLTIGVIAGVTAVRDSIISEMSDLSGSVQDLNQSYGFTGTAGHSATLVGSAYIDASDFCDDPNDVAGQVDNCISFSNPAIVEVPSLR